MWRNVYDSGKKCVQMWNADVIHIFSEICLWVTMWSLFWYERFCVLMLIIVFDVGYTFELFIISKKEKKNHFRVKDADKRIVTGVSVNILQFLSLCNCI